MAEPRARLTRAAVEWGLRALALECMSVSRVARTLGISWHTANNAILASAQATLLDDPHRFDGVEVLGVDEYVWRHTRRGDRYVTVIIDLTPRTPPQWSGPASGRGTRPVQEGPTSPTYHTLKHEEPVSTVDICITVARPKAVVNQLVSLSMRLYQQRSNSWPTRVKGSTTTVESCTATSTPYVRQRLRSRIYPTDKSRIVPVVADLRRTMSTRIRLPMTTSMSPTAKATAEKTTPPLTFCSRLWRCSTLKESSWRESCWVTVPLGSNCLHHLQRGHSRDLEIVTILSQKSMYDRLYVILLEVISPDCAVIIDS